MYIRFVFAARPDNPWIADGVFVAAHSAVEERELPKDVADEIQATFDWFNEHIPVPPFSDRLERGIWTRQAVCWFHVHAAEPIERLRRLSLLLAAHGKPTRQLSTAKPGRIVYHDHFQVVAETPRRAYAGLVCAAL